MLLVVIAISTGGGLVVAAQRRGQHRALEAARTRERVLGDAADDAVRAERVAVARELHDVVSHAVGVIAMQAAAGELSWPGDAGATHRAVDIIRRTSTATLADLERLAPSADGPRHGVEDLVSLVERVRQGGTPVDLTVTGGFPAHADVVHRVVQESLTNAMRHAPGAPVVVTVRSDPMGTEVVVEDGGQGPRTSSRRGYGLVGLAERVAFVHGTFESGAGDGGRGFRVRVSLPRVDTMSTT